MNLHTHDYAADVIAEDLPAVELREGRIFWRGRFMPRAEAERLRDQFAANQTDWFRNHAASFAAQLTEALRHVQ